MKAYVAVTDQRWAEFLAARPQLTEANFWMPSGRQATFGAVKPGEPFIFKTHRPHDRLVGGGFLIAYRQLLLSEAWDTFGAANGASSLEEMRAAIGHYRRRPLAASDDPVIGCAMLRDTYFFPEQDLRVENSLFAPNLVKGKSFELGDFEGSAIEAAFHRLATAKPEGLDGLRVDLAWAHDGPMFGAARRLVPRLGQAAFAAVISDAYARRCAVTGARIRPTLQAAHIRPVAAQGQHRVDNGLLLRADVHIMFDRGYLGVHPERGTLQVSSQLREVFGNGEEFYSRAGLPIALPARRGDRPKGEFLEWHLDSVFHA